LFGNCPLFIDKTDDDAGFWRTAAGEMFVEAGETA
jgi:hypothetical protein